MVDSLGLSPMARHQRRVNPDEQFVSLPEYLEVKDGTKTTEPIEGLLHKIAINS
jgi:hypothetical protein